MIVVELLRKYTERFDENFPLFSVVGIEDKEIKEIILRCLEDGKPYIPDEIEDDSLY